MSRPEEKREDFEREPETETLEADAVHPEPGVFSRARPLGRTFASFHYRDYSLLWTGSLLSNIGTWMQIVAVSWVVYELTRSAFALGIVNFLNSLPVFLFVLYAGSVADRVERRMLLLVTQAFLLLVALALGAMASMGTLIVPWIYVLTFATGLGTAFTFPTWQAMIPELVPRRDLMNAIALNSAQFNGARMVGPAIAGLVLASFGAAVNFFANAVSFLAVIIALLLIRPRPVVPHAESGWTHFTEGLRYAKEHPRIGLLLVSIGVLTLFGLSFVVLLPLYASRILDTGAEGYGFLGAASGLGSLAGALTIAALAHAVQRDKLVKWTMAATGVFLILFAVSRSYVLSLFLIAGFGWSFLAGTSTINSLIQESVPSELRGRIMSIYVWMFLGLQPFGSLIFGSVAGITSPPVPIIAGGLVVIAAALLLFVRPEWLAGR
ncbi:MAG: MFS transporter [Candidatus Aquicultorales bacterium]